MFSYLKPFHEKAGVSQVCFFFVAAALFRLSRVASVAILPSALFTERFSLGASWASSFQQVLLPDNRPRLPSLRWRLGQDLVVGVLLMCLLESGYWAAHVQSSVPAPPRQSGKCRPDHCPENGVLRSLGLGLPWWEKCSCTRRVPRFGKFTGLFTFAFSRNQ